MADRMGMACHGLQKRMDAGIFCPGRRVDLFSSQNAYEFCGVFFGRTPRLCTLGARLVFRLGDSFCGGFPEPGRALVGGEWICLFLALGDSGDHR